MDFLIKQCHKHMNIYNLKIQRHDFHKIIIATKIVSQIG